jgi:DNA-binding CsgD family transcriptional regulator/Tfp pilus assembly protein PilF
VRAFLREQLAAHGEEAAADLLMARTCAVIAREAGQFLAAGRSREQLDLLERELNNVRAALPILLRAAPEQALGLVVDLTGLWETRRVREGREWLGRALGAGGAGLDADQRAWGLLTAALLAHYQGDTAAARGSASDALDAARSGGTPLTLARALYIDALGHGTTPPAAERYRESLALCEQLGDEAGVAMASNDLAEIARGAGDLESATALYERALALWRALGDASGVARAAHNLGHTLRAGGEPERARALLREALQSSRSIGDRNQGAAAVAGLVAVAAGAAPSAAVATLLGVAQAEIEAADIVLEPVDAEPLRAAAATLLAALGRERFDQACGRGRRMGEDERWALAERIATRAPASPPDALTDREIDVVRLLADGLTNGEIAQRLVVSDHTVHRHVSNILGKLGVPSRAAAASLAARRGLL